MREFPRTAARGARRTSAARAADAPPSEKRARVSNTHSALRLRHPFTRIQAIFVAAVLEPQWRPEHVRNALRTIRGVGYVAVQSLLPMRWAMFSRKGDNYKGAVDG